MNILTDLTDGFSHIQHNIPVPVDSPSPVRTDELDDDEDAQGDTDHDE